MSISRIQRPAASQAGFRLLDDESSIENLARVTKPGNDYIIDDDNVGQYMFQVPSRCETLTLGRRAERQVKSEDLSVRIIVCHLSAEMKYFSGRKNYQQAVTECKPASKVICYAKITSVRLPNLVKIS